MFKKISLRKFSLFLITGLTILGNSLITPAQTPTSTNNRAEHQIEPQAIELLKAMSKRLSSARSMTFTSVTTYESPSRIGPPLIYTTISDVTLQRPDKLRVITPGDGPATEFYYDGKTITAYSPKENLVAVSAAPATIATALKMAYDSAAIYFPFTDIVVDDPYQDIADGLKVAFVVGQSQVVGGTKTDIVVVSNDQVFAQIWIGVDDKLPRRIRAVYRDDPSRLRHQVEFENWRLDVPILPDTFTSSQASGALKIPFARPDIKLTPAKTDKPAPIKP